MFKGELKESFGKNPANMPKNAAYRQVDVPRAGAESEMAMESDLHCAVQGVGPGLDLTYSVSSWCFEMFI
jgi:hypothetical protein